MNDILTKVLEQCLENSTAAKKPYYLIGDLNINCLAYFKNEKVSIFYSSLFECGVIALINKPTQVPKKPATIIHNAITTEIFDESLKKCIIKSDLSYHLPIFFSISTSKFPQNSRNYIENNLASFKDQVSNINWDSLNSTQCNENCLS